MNKPTCKLKATSRPSRFVPRTTVCGDRLGCGTACCSATSQPPMVKGYNASVLLPMPRFMVPCLRSEVSIREQVKPLHGVSGTDQHGTSVWSSFRPFRRIGPLRGQCHLIGIGSKLRPVEACEVMQALTAQLSSLRLSVTTGARGTHPCKVT